MSERFKGCVVSFDNDYYREDAELIVKVISMVRGVSGVTLDTHEVDHEDFMARERIKEEYAQKVLDLYRELTKR